MQKYDLQQKGPGERARLGVMYFFKKHTGKMKRSMLSCRGVIPKRSLVRSPKIPKPLEAALRFGVADFALRPMGPSSIPTWPKGISNL